MVLLVYLSWGIFDPTDIGLLSAFYFLPPLWLVVVMFGIWCWWCARDAASLWLALCGAFATPLMLAIQSGLLQAELLPIAEGTPAYVILGLGLFTYPVVLVVRLLMRLSRPRAEATQPLAAPFSARVVQVWVTLLVVLALLLVGNLFAGGSWLGKGVFETWLNVGLWVSLITGLFVGPLVLLSMLRRSLPLGFSMWILTALVIIALSYFGIFTFIAIHSAG